MNLEHFCTSLSALFEMYSLNMSEVTNLTRFCFGTSCIFSKICQNKNTQFLLIFLANICSQKWHKNDYKLVKNSCMYITSSVFESINMSYLIFMQRKTFLKYLCTHKYQINFYFLQKFAKICTSSIIIHELISLMNNITCDKSSLKAKGVPFPLIYSALTIIGFKRSSW